MKINSVASDTYVIKDGLTQPIEDVRADWDSYTQEEKEGWYTITCKRQKVDAENVIDWILEDMVYNGYEDMDVMVRDQLTDDDKAKLQAVLDEIFDNSACDVFYPSEPIEDEE